MQAIEDLIRLSPNCFIVIDEFGRWFRMIQDQSGNAGTSLNVVQAMGTETEWPLRRDRPCKPP